ncbi:MAG: hypothetical protein HY869_00875 [Chloroflexi bacterium]|nr:hypothetical protein [Chloroflexota bacterium]
MSEAAFIDSLGWVGTVIYLIAYYLVSAKKVESDSLRYQGMNIMAGALLVINTFYWRSFPSLGLNVAWIGIGVYTLGRKWMLKQNVDKA